MDKILLENKILLACSKNQNLKINTLNSLLLNFLFAQMILSISTSMDSSNVSTFKKRKVMQTQMQLKKLSRANNPTKTQAVSKRKEKILVNNLKTSSNKRWVTTCWLHSSQYRTETTPMTRTQYLTTVVFDMMIFISENIQFDLPSYNN